MNENLFNVKIIILNSTTYSNTRYDRVYAPASTPYSQKNDILGITAYCLL